MFDSQQTWGAEFWPAGPWGHITIAPGEQSCLLHVDGGVVEVELVTGRVLRTIPSPALPATRLATSADGRTAVTRVTDHVEVTRSGEHSALVLPPGSTVWPSPDGSLLLIRAPWDRSRHRDGAVSLLRWRDRQTIRVADDGGGVVQVAWLGERVAYAARHGLLHIWAPDGPAVRASIPDQPVGLVPLVRDGQELLLLATSGGRSGRTELRSAVDGSVVRVVSTTRSLTGAVTTDGRLVTVQGLVVSLTTGETLREISRASPIQRIVISPRGDRAVFADLDRLVLFDLVRWESIRSLEAVRPPPGYPFGGAFLPDGERFVVVEAGGRVALLDAVGEVLWKFALTRDPSWEGAWELPAWSRPHVRTTDEVIVVEVEWILRGPVEGDGHQDHEARTRSMVLGLDGVPVDRAPPLVAAVPEVSASIERHASGRESIVVRRRGAVLRELDVTLAHGAPTAVAIAQDASWLLVGTRRGLLLGYR